MGLPYKYTFSVFTVVSLIVALGFIGCGGGGGSTNPSENPTLTLSVNPSTTTVYPGTSFNVTVDAQETGTTATPAVTLGTLPAGITSTTKFPLNVPPSGATINFVTASSVAVGSFTIPLSGTAGSATAQASLGVQVSALPAPAFFITPLFSETEVAQGQSTSEQFQLDGSSGYPVTVSITNLPDGVTAMISPQTVNPGGNFTVTFQAAGTAPPAQDVIWDLIGTPALPIANTVLQLLINVTKPTSVGWSNRTGYVGTRGTPFGAVYDSAHQLIYSSNLVWDRVDIISDANRTLAQSIPLRDPRGLALSLDGKTVWISTGSEVMYGIDTTSLKATRYLLPNNGVSGSSPGTSWEGGQVLPLADGTLMLIYSTTTELADEHADIWNPSTNTLRPILPPTGGDIPAQWAIVTGSADGTHVFSIGDDSDETCFSYNALTKTLSAPIQLSGYGFSAIASPDGSKVAISDFEGFNLYDSNFQLIGALPGDGGGPSSGANERVYGGSMFSADGGLIYQETLASYIPFIATINVESRQVTALAPAMPVIPANISEMSPPYFIPAPFAMDTNGLLLGIQYRGIAFDDPAAHIKFNNNVPGTPTNMQHMTPYSGEVAGGTTSSGFGNAFSLIPDVFYGATKGSASLNQNSLSITSPSATHSGPVDLKFLFPDGTEVYNPAFFTYGLSLQDAIISAGPPQGGVAGQLDAFGIPLDPGEDAVTIGGNHASITSVPTQYPPFEGEQTSLLLSYTVPSGSPGWQDMSVTAPNGSSTLPKSFFYAKSVTDYPTSDSATFVLYDGARNQIYLSAGNHIDVFSLDTNSFTTPLTPPAGGTKVRFQGLALTPDGHYLVAADLTDNTLAAINPDSPSDNFYVFMSPAPSPPCPAGPLFVAADKAGQAYVVTGSETGTTVQNTACSTGGVDFIVNLTTKTSMPLKNAGCIVNSGYVQASKDGSIVAFGGGSHQSMGLQLFGPAQNACLPVAHPAEQYGIAASGDGNTFAILQDFIDSSGNLAGRMGHPLAYYSNAVPTLWYNYSPRDLGALEQPQLNDAGSLYIWAFPNFVDFVDVQHGLIRIRLSLSETVTNTVSPMAIDSGGQHIFLITNKGLTVVDMGEAPLSIGYLSQNTASVGSQIVIRGSGFVNGITAQVGGLSAGVTLTDDNTLTLTIPAANKGLEDVTLNNPDGSNYTLNNALTIQ